MKKVLDKILTHTATLSALFGYYQGISKIMKNNLGFGFSKFIFYYKKGSMTEYRYGSHLLKKIILNIFNKRPKFEKKLLDTFPSDYKKLEELSDHSKRIKNDNEAINKIFEFEKTFQNIWTPVMYIYWLPIFLESEKVNKEQKRRIDKIIKIRSQRDREYVLAQYFYDHLCLYLRNKFNYLKMDFTLCSPEELIDSLRGKKFGQNKIKKINSREKGCIIFRDQIYSNLKKVSEINEFLSEYNLILEKEEKVKKVNKIKGKSANPGQAKGKVVLLFSKNEMKKVDKETIIVSPMTTPYLNPALKNVRQLLLTKVVLPATPPLSPGN